MFALAIKQLAEEGIRNVQSILFELLWKTVENIYPLITLIPKLMHQDGDKTQTLLVFPLGNPGDTLTFTAKLDSCI